MKRLEKNRSLPVIPTSKAKGAYQLFATLLLSGILSLGPTLTWLQVATAAPGVRSQSEARELLKERDDLAQNNNRNNRGRRGDDRNQTDDRDETDDEDDRLIRTNRLPQQVLNAIRRDLSRRVRVPAGRLRVVSYSRQTWPNGCLGLPRPDEFCTEALVEGWRVVVSDGSRRWTYRTDLNGRIVRAETQTTSSANLPSSVRNAVLRDVSRRSGVSTSSLRIVAAERRDWPNGCLGLNEPGIGCTQAIVPGWRVTVAYGEQRWVYRTNQSGSVIKLDTAASNIDDDDSTIDDGDEITPTRIPTSELPARLPSNAVFRAISSGGIAGRTYQTTLLTNGQVVRVQVNASGTTSQRQTGQVSRQEVQEFQRLLDRQRFSQFNRLSYNAPRGSADYITVTLSSRSATTRYADLGQDRLPDRLQAIAEAWNDIVDSAL